ncbi:MAG: hypothetical protein KDM64_09205, partial [Verrucomicrobiae bacterium]|nr:hypothetical protein [Verrucomicrobiae bacterium]
MSEQEAAAQTWRSLARRIVRKVNVGWWLQRLSPLLILGSLIIAAAILILRSQAHPYLGSPWLPAGGGAALLAIVLGSWLLARRQFLKEKDGLVRLEDRLRLRNALTTAAQGIGQWPEAPSDSRLAEAGWRMNWLRVLAPFAIAILAIAAAVLVPIATVEAARPPASEPLAWAQMDDWMELLDEEDLIDDQAIEEVKEKIEELRQQPENEWFSHSSLEATDTLRQTLQQQIQGLGAELAIAERDLNALQNFGDQIGEETKEKLLNEYDQALQNLALSGLPLNPELMNALKGIDPKQLSQGQMNGMSAEQLQQLREALQKAAQACSQCNNPGQNGEGLPKLCEGDALAAFLKQCQGPGRGGITRGPGEAPLFLGDKETNLK